MAMTRAEHEMLESLRTNLDRTERERAVAQTECDLRSRMFEILADVFRLTDEDRDNVRRQALGDPDHKWIPMCSR